MELSWINTLIQAQYHLAMGQWINSRMKLESYVNKIMKIALVFLTLLFFAPWNQAKAQFSDFRYVDSLAKFESIPTDLVLDMMGIGPSQITHPGTSSALLNTLIPISDLKGRLKPAFAVSVAPYQLFAGTSISIYDYISNWVDRFYANSQISLGTAPTKQIDSSLDFGIGLRLVLINTGDGRLNVEHINDLVNKASAILAANPLPAPGDPNAPAKLAANAKAVADQVEANNAKVAAPTAAQDHERWNSTFLEFNVGTVFRASEALISKSAHDRTQLWLNGGAGYGIFQFQGQVGVLFRNPNKEFYPDSASEFIGAFQLRIGNPNFRIGAGAKLIGSGSLTLSGSFESRLADNAWVLFTLSRQAAPHMFPTPWGPSFSIRTTMGNFNF
jgi:hypothetical protein